MKRKVLLFSLCLLACLANSYAEKATSIDKDNTEKTTEEEPKKIPANIGRLRRSSVHT